MALSHPTRRMGPVVGNAVRPSPAAYSVGPFVAANPEG